MNNKVKSNVQVKRGEIWFVDFGVGNGRVQGSKRPAVVISNSKCNEMSPVITVVALTSNVEKSLSKKLPTQVFVSKQCGLQSDSIALCEQPRSIDKSQLDFKVGEVDTETMILIEKATMIQIGIKQSNNICNNQNITTAIDTNISMTHAKELWLSISKINKVIKELGDSTLVNDLLSAKETLVNEFVSYCKKFGKDYKEVTTQIKSMLPVRQNKIELAMC